MVALAGLGALSQQARWKPKFPLEVVKEAGCWCDATQSDCGDIQR